MTRAGGLVLIALLLAAGPSLAGKTSAESEARQRYASGMKHYDLGEWDAAIADFKQAFALTDRAPLLFNLGQAARKKHDWEAARNFYQAYLRRIANPPNAADVKRFIVEAEEEMRKAAAQAAVAAAATATVEKPPPVENPPTLAVEKPPPPLPPLPIDRAPVVVEIDRHPGRSLKRIGLATLVGGVLLLGGALACGLYANDDASQLAGLAQMRGAWSDHYQSLYSSGQAATLGFDALVALGGVAVIAGGALALLGVRRDAAAQRVGLVAVPGGAALTVGGSF